MKKIFYSTGLFFLLLACTKDKDVAGLNSDDAIMASGKTVNGAETEINTIHITHSTFSPSYAEANVNSTWRWKNDDNITHTVTSDKFDSGDIPGGGTFKLTFDNTGTYNYHCRYHGETGVIVVQGIR